MHYPIGWANVSDVHGWDWFFKVLGWSITGLAVSLGAGFWFDMLSKVLQLRGTGPKVSSATGLSERDSR